MINIKGVKKSYLIQRNKELLDEILSMKKELINMEALLSEDFSVELVSINREKEVAILSALDALNFYANTEFYHDNSEGEYSTVDLDGGKQARLAIDLIKDLA